MTGITIRQVEFFCAVADSLHFGKAAEAMFVSQSVVSQEVRRLELRLGVSLFDRSTRNVRLSADGERLLAPARELIAASTRFGKVGELLSASRSQAIRIAASPSAMNDLIPYALRLAEDALPDVEVEDVEVETGEVAAALASGRADIGIGRYLDVDESYHCEELRREPLYVAVSSRHPLAQARRAELAQLADLPLLLWPRERNPRYYDELLRACASGGLEPLVLVSRPRIIGARSYLIAENRAFGLLPESATLIPAPGIRIVPLDLAFSVPLEMAWSKADQRPSVQRLLRLLRTAANTPVGA